MILKCQGCGEPRATALVKEVATGEIRAWCWRCMMKHATPDNAAGTLLTLNETHENWPPQEDE